LTQNELIFEKNDVITYNVINGSEFWVKITLARKNIRVPLTYFLSRLCDIEKIFLDLVIFLIISSTFHYQFQ